MCLYTKRKISYNSAIYKTYLCLYSILFLFLKKISYNKVYLLEILKFYYKFAKPGSVLKVKFVITP